MPKLPPWPPAENTVRWVQQAEVEDDPVLRDELLKIAEDSVAVAEIPLLLAALPDGELDEARLQFAKRLLRKLASADLPGARQVVEGFPSGSWRSDAIESLASQWAEQWPVDAGNWARTLLDGQERSSAIRAVAYEFARCQPEGAVHLALEVSPEGGRDELLCHTVMEWTSRDPTAARDWVAGLSDLGLRSRLLGAVATAWSDQDPVAAATLAAEVLPAGRVQNDVVVSIVARWVQIAPNDAAAWVEQFPEGELKSLSEEVVANLVKSPESFD